MYLAFADGYIQTPGWNRLTQALIDSRTYITGRDTDRDRPRRQRPADPQRGRPRRLAARAISVSNRRPTPASTLDTAWGPGGSAHAESSSRTATSRAPKPRPTISTSANSLSERIQTQAPALLRPARSTAASSPTAIRPPMTPGRPKRGITWNGALPRGWPRAEDRSRACLQPPLHRRSARDHPRPPPWTGGTYWRPHFGRDIFDDPFSTEPGGIGLGWEAMCARPGPTGAFSPWRT